MSAASARLSPAATQSSFPFTNDVPGTISTGDGAATGGLTGFSSDGVEGAGDSATLATPGGIEDGLALEDEFVDGLSTGACALSIAGLAGGVAAIKDCGFKGEALVAKPFAGEAFSAWIVIEGCP
jgi:hypothetical protein